MSCPANRPANRTPAAQTGLTSLAVVTALRTSLSPAAHGCLLTDNRSELTLPVAGCRL